MIILVIGGTGTLGKHVVPILLKDPRVSRIRILSRGEHAQMEMQEALDDERLDFFIGDVRDRERVLKATEHCDLVFHFAAVKSVDKAEYDPWEAVLTNIIGTKNVIEACQTNNVRHSLFTSTDKAVSPLNLYGSTKLCAEKLFVQGNIGSHKARFSVCRYGNVLSSNGSVLPRWRKNFHSHKRISITDAEMTRFFISPKNAAQFVVNCSNDMAGGEVFIPKMKSTTMLNLARAAFDDFKIEDAEIVGLRPGEKMHEVLISDDEVSLVTELHDKFIRWPELKLFPTLTKGTPIKSGFTSKTAERFSMDELKELVCAS